MNNLFDQINSGKNNYTGGQISKFASSLVQKSEINGKDLTPGYLHFLKASPRINRNYSGLTSNYIYVLLDPNKPIKNIEDFSWDLPKNIFGIDNIKFGFEPFYIGKGVSSTGHRMNQHVARFEQSKEDETKKENLQKQNRLNLISGTFNKPHADSEFYIHPKNWNEYKKEWIITIFEFKDRDKLEVAERELIKIIGSINGIKKGPLTNISFTKEEK